MPDHPRACVLGTDWVAAQPPTRDRGSRARGAELPKRPPDPERSSVGPRRGHQSLHLAMGGQTSPLAFRLAPIAPTAADDYDEQAKRQVDSDDLANAVEGGAGARPILDIDCAFERQPCSPYGMGCTECNDLLVAPKWSAFVS